MGRSNPLYHTLIWQKVRDYVLARDNYLCQPCLMIGKITEANTVHHTKPVEDYPELALDPEYMESCCPACHNKAHPEKRKKQKKLKKKKRRARVIKSRPNPTIPPLP